MEAYHTFHSSLHRGNLAPFLVGMDMYIGSPNQVAQGKFNSEDKDKAKWKRSSKTIHFMCAMKLIPPLPESMQLGLSYEANGLNLHSESA